MTNDLSDGGVSIVLSPVQLSAVLQGESVGPAETDMNRFFDRAVGALMVVGGAMELVAAGALLAAPDPSLVSKVVAGIAGENAAENIGTGVRDLWTGRDHATPTEQAARRAAIALGCKPQTAGKIGLAIDIAVPVAVGFAVGALRAIAIREGMIDLAAEEEAGGHTIERHVGKSDQFLLDRVTPPRAKSAAGTFNNLKEAEKLVSKVIAANRQTISTWVSAGSDRDLILNYENSSFFSSSIVGRVIQRGTTHAIETSRLRVVLRATRIEGRTWFVLTAYPVQ